MTIQIFRFILILNFIFPSLLFAANSYKTRPNPFTGKPDYVLGTDNLEVTNMDASNTVTGLVVCFEGGTNDTYFTGGSPSTSEYYYLPSTDGTSGQVLHTDGSGLLSWDTDDGAGGGAPTDADYLVGTANGSLSAEIIVGTSPGGELGNTWASPTLDDSVTVTGWELGASTASTSITSPAHLSNNADPADAGIVRLGNAENIAWEASPAGTDETLTLSSDENFQISGPIEIDASDPADAEAIRLDNAEGIAWEASPTGTDVTLKVDASEILQASGTFNAATLTEGGVAVYNDDEIDTYSEINAIVADVTLTHNGLIDTSAELLAILGDETGTGALTFATSPTFTTSIALPQGTAPTVDAAGEIAVDTTDDQLIYYGGAKRVIPYTQYKCAKIENLAAADDNYGIWMANDACTIVSVGVHCDGTCTTAADIDLSDRAGNAMTHGAPTVSVTTGNTTFTAVTAANTLVAGEGLEFSVANAVSPETDEYLICFGVTYDAQ